MNSKILFIVMVMVCAISAYFYKPMKEYIVIHKIPSDFRRFNVDDSLPVCGRWKDHMPKIRNGETYHIYIQARKLWRSKIEWQLTRDELNKIFHDTELAARKGDWGARALLANFYREGLGPMASNHVLDPDPEKSVAIVRAAVAAGQPWAFYDLGVAYEHGYGGMPYDEEIAWAYYLKAAELGSPDAQMTLANAYNARERWDKEKAMIRCAYEQGHGEAANLLAIYAELGKNFGEALKLDQQGVKFGSQRSAASLYLLFDSEFRNEKSKEDRDALIEIGAQPDDERMSRYRQISEALKINPDLRFSRLDEVLPLPPAKLPEWKGVEDALDPETCRLPTY